MTSIDATEPALLRGIAAIFPFFTSRLTLAANARDEVEEARDRRAFVQEMLSRNPKAFSSDLDVQAMMQHYPGSL